MKILVTGSTGFIGSHVCRALVEAGHSVRAFHRATSLLRNLEGLEVEHFTGDLTRPETLDPAMQGVEAVFHVAAWLGGNQPGKHYAVTVEGTRMVLRAARRAGVRRVVHTSSVAALGVPPPGKPLLLDERHTWNIPSDRYPYGYAKYLAEMEVQKAVAAGLDAVIVNPALVIGPGDVYRQSTSLAGQLASGRIPPVSVEGGINLVHVADVTTGHLAALEKGRTGERYILGGENLTFTQQLRMAAQAVGMNPPVTVLPGALLRLFARPIAWAGPFLNLPVPADLFYLAGRYFFYDTRKAREQLGLGEPIPARRAIEEAVAWFKG